MTCETCKNQCDCKSSEAFTRLPKFGDTKGSEYEPDTMTDSEVVKALECCANNPNDCVCYESKCPLFGQKCIDILSKNALDLITRQKAVIKNLTSGKCVYLSDDETTEYCVEGPCPNYKTEAQIKVEAYKEFAERLKEWFRKESEVYKLIDNLLKELVGENNA